MPATKESRQKEKELTFERIKKNHIMAFIYFARIDDVIIRGDQNQPTLSCTNLDTQEMFKVIGRPLIESAMSADVYDREERITKTEMAEKLSTAYNRPFTVEFLRQDKKVRVLRGILVKPEPLFGRSMCFDFEKGEVRLVTHVALRSLTIAGVHYTIKR